MKQKEDEIKAGIKNFDVLREFNVLYALANGNPLDLDRAFNLDYNTAHLYLTRRAIEARYTDKLNDLIMAKK